MTSSIWRHNFFTLIILFEKKSIMEANSIIEINSALDDKQNAEIRWILQNRCHIFNVIYFIKMLIKVNQIHTISFNMHVLSSIVISRLYIKYTNSYRSWQPLNMIIFGNILVPVLWRQILWRHYCLWRLPMSHVLSDPSLKIQVQP